MLSKYLNKKVNIKLEKPKDFISRANIKLLSVKNYTLFLLYLKEQVSRTCRYSIDFENEIDNLIYMTSFQKDFKLYINIFEYANKLINQRKLYPQLIDNYLKDYNYKSVDDIPVLCCFKEKCIQDMIKNYKEYIFDYNCRVYVDDIVCEPFLARYYRKSNCRLLKWDVSLSVIPKSQNNNLKKDQ